MWKTQRQDKTIKTILTTKTKKAKIDATEKKERGNHHGSKKAAKGNEDKQRQHFTDQNKKTAKSPDTTPST